MDHQKDRLRWLSQGGFRMDGEWVWCGCAVRGEDGVHLYASAWSKKDPMFFGYIFNSRIVHAFAKSAEEPFRFVEDVVPAGVNSPVRMAHNPTVLRYRNEYLLYFIGTTYEGEPRIDDAEMRSEVYGRIRIYLARSASPAGPWTVLPEPVFTTIPDNWDSSIVTNPAPCVGPDDRIYLFYRSNPPQGLRIGLAIADRPEGPYVRQGNGPVLEGFSVEDPFVWHDGKDFRMFAKDMDGSITGEKHAGAAFVSANGIKWEYSHKAYSRTVVDSRGNEIHLGSLERPQPLIEADGSMRYLFAAAADGPGGFRNAANTWNACCLLPQGK